MKTKGLILAKPKSFDELCRWALRRLFDALLRGGSNAMRSELFIIFPAYAKWREEYDAYSTQQQEIERKKKRRPR